MPADAWMGVTRAGRPVQVVEAELDLFFPDLHDFAAAAEAGLKQLLRRQGWKTATIPPPAGAAGRGRRLTDPGPDLVAYRIDPQGRFRMTLFDNKATHPLTKRPPGAVRQATGLSAISLTANLPKLISKLSRSANPLDRKAVTRLRQLHKRAKKAVSRAVRGAPASAVKQRATNATVRLPRGVDVLVTNVGGRAPAIRRLPGHIGYLDVKSPPLARTWKW
jgi:hypothetical protein